MMTDEKVNRFAPKVDGAMNDTLGAIASNVDFYLFADSTLGEIQQRGFREDGLI